MWPTDAAVAVYGFGNASGKGFGSTLVIAGELYFWHGQWTPNVEMESSNYQELNNLVCTIEESFTAGLLEGHELFMLTDNSSAEATGMAKHWDARGVNAAPHVALLGHFKGEIREVYHLMPIIAEMRSSLKP